MINIRDYLDILMMSAKAIAKDSLDWGCVSEPNPSAQVWKAAFKTDASYLVKQANMLKGKTYEISKLVRGQIMDAF
jgi:hypothetical protein